jgi:hypothetical protein
MKWLHGSIASADYLPLCTILDIGLITSNVCCLLTIEKTAEKLLFFMQLIYVKTKHKETLATVDSWHYSTDAVQKYITSDLEIILI